MRNILRSTSSPPSKRRFFSLPPLVDDEPGLQRPHSLRARLLTPRTIAIPEGAVVSPPRDAPARRAVAHGFIWMSGYVPANAALYRAWNLALAVTLFVICLPIFVLITFLLALTQGPRNVFYTGTRIGKDGKLFNIVKFKTLKDSVAQLTQDQVLPTNSSMETALGKPLRETRLDELPQLLNVLKGDMNMLGPRPVRPSIAKQYRHTIRDYGVRFQVKPGLVGYTQALMPHRADKRVRAKVNTVLCRRRVNLLQELLFIGLTGLGVLQWIGRVSWRGVRSCLPLEFLGLVPVMPGIEVRIAGTPFLNARLLKIDGSTLLLETSSPLPQFEDPCPVMLLRTGRTGIRGKTAHCRMTVEQTERAVRLSNWRRRPVFRHVLDYRPTTPFQQYLIDRYFVGGVLVR